MENAFALFRDSLLEAMNVASRSNEIDRVVDTFLAQIRTYYSFDCAEVYLITGDTIILRGIAGLDRYYVCKVYQNAWSPPFKESLESSQTYCGANMNTTGFPEFDGFAHMALIPFGAVRKNIGAMIVRERDEGNAARVDSVVGELANLLGHFAIYADVVLQTSKADENARRLFELKEMETRFETCSDIAPLVDRLADDLRKIFATEGAYVRLREGKSDAFAIRSIYGVDSNTLDYLVTEENPYLLRTKENGGIVCVNDLQNSEMKGEVKSVSDSLMTVELRAFNATVGYATLSNKLRSATNPIGHFLEEDRALLKNFGAHMAGRLHREQMHIELEGYTRKNEIANQKLNLLYDLTSVLLGQSSLPSILYILLTSATTGDAFGFNRAFFYLYNEQNALFKGNVGVGPSSAEDAHRIWSEIQNAQKDRRLFDRIISMADNNVITAKLGLINVLTQSEIPADDRCPIFQQALTTREVINVANPRVTNVDAFTDIFGKVPFAIVPVSSEKRFIGALVVDNPYNGNPIDLQDLEFLKMFANQTGVAIEYSFAFGEVVRQTAELKATRLKLNEAQRLALVGEMAASMSHNLRNAIFSIGGFANRLVRREGLDDVAQRYSKIIADESKKLEMYLQKNLSFAKSVHMNIETVTVAQICERTSSLAQERIESSRKHIAFFVVTEGAPESIDCDYPQIHDALHNLIINAIDAVPEHGAEITMVVTSDRDRCVIAITNTYSFISHDKIAVLFDPFYTTKEHGIGLGLGTTKRVVEAHGGTIVVRSSSGENGAVPVTSFFVSLPIRQPAAAGR